MTTKLKDIEDENNKCCLFVPNRKTKMMHCLYTYNVNESVFISKTKNTRPKGTVN